MFRDKKAKPRSLLEYYYGEGSEQRNNAHKDAAESVAG
jgi:hypothetical protein